MKISYSIVLFILCFAFCKKDPGLPDISSPYWGEAFSEKNGNTWIASPYAKININLKNGVINLSIDSVDQYGILREKCSIYKVPPIPGKYPVANTFISTKDSLVGANFFYSEADVLYGVYNILDSDSSSFVTVISYDTLSKEIRGSFDLTFIVGRQPYMGAPDTIRLRKGSFHTKVIK